MKSVFIVYILLSGSFIFAGEPLSDYNFVCVASDAKTDSNLQVEGGVDPSGGFAVDIRATNEWKSLNNAFYMAESFSLKNGTKYVSVAYEKPRTTIRIYWNKRLSENEYQGSIQRSGLNHGRPLKFACKVELQ